MNTRELFDAAPRRLGDAPAGKKIVLYYAGILTALSGLGMLMNFLLNLQISKTGGLGSMGVRSVLEALQSMVPMVQSALLMCVAVGYQAAMLRIARGQYASPQTLRLGFGRFWVLLRSGIAQGLIYLAIGMASMYLASLIFTMTPWANALMEIVAPMIAGLDSTLTTPALDPDTVARLIPVMRPMIWIFLGLFVLFALPVSLRLRMVNYVIIDKPGTGALAALGESRKMMRYHVLDLLRLDLRLWWWYAALAFATVLCYADTLLPALGVQLPLSPTAAYYVFYVLYLAVQFALYYCLGNRVEVTYALAYEEVRPHEEPSNGAVLGNIFQM
ncbi:MAG: hypothetical protein Q4F17_06100 [Eubacteriales bacterium]|nr:hypothetical protein [Eubacteriales bacterium]